MRVDPISEGLALQNQKQGVTLIVSLAQIADNLLSGSSPLKV